MPTAMVTTTRITDQVVAIGVRELSQRARPRPGVVLEVALEPEARLGKQLRKTQHDEPEQERRDQPERGGGRALIADHVIVRISDVDEPGQLRGRAFTKAETIGIAPLRLGADFIVGGLYLATLANRGRSDHAASQLD